ncbi:sulfatase-like hydrolase/transferase [Altererythrobacter sp. H2]|uniref:sulfatase family protein n=1 Tax=Altererythrobacter sp. H2 TaxID=3108391 RepID=UPI002B4BBE17|nr:sulfatase-like hydrolase/transferase [Altererythrobacter sp. H2]WRK95165.1 sulfatase-like hydrolase/transferase [Altererythrobacter sp. H2]
MTFTLDRRTMLAASAASLAAPALARTPVKRPNVLFILADDMGYADLSCYGRRNYETPAIDALAAQGMRLTSGYANSPVCSATRTALMTGRYQYRLPVGLEEPLAFRDMGLPPDEPTLPSQLRKAGYATSLIGKWHLGAAPKFGPRLSGYEHFFGIQGGGADYFTHASGRGHDLWDNETTAGEHGYLTDILAREAIEQLGRHAADSRPFFMSLHFTAPHWPWEGPNDQAESARLAATGEPAAIFHYDGGTMATYAAIMRRLDEKVGEVLAALQQLGLADDTIVVFTSDNGGERFSDNWPFSGRKTELLEGGVRVPLIVRWPGRITAGSESAVPVMSMDWLPTFLGLAGSAPAPERQSDGVDVLPVLLGSSMPVRPLFWRYRHLDQASCRFGDHKYLRINGNEFLFDVVQDPLERGNLKARQPSLFADLKARWTSWNETMLPFDPDSFSHGFHAKDMADRFGVE